MRDTLSTRGSRQVSLFFMKKEKKGKEEKGKR